MKSLLAYTLSVFAAASAFAAADPAYTALRAARPDGRTIALNNVTFERDVYRVTLNGTLHLLEPVAGKDVGAVFTGSGSYELTPFSDVERRSLSVNAADPALKSLRDEFDAMTIFDAALIADEAKKTPPVKGAPAAAATQAYDRFLEFQRKELKSNVHIRVLQALLNGETTPLFIAAPAGKKFSRMLLVVDGLGNLDGEETALMSADDQRGGQWYSSHMRGERPHGETKIAQAAHYIVDTTFAGRDDLAGTTIIDAMAATDGLRVLPLELDAHLRVEEASFAADPKAESWTPMAFVQEKEKEDGDLAVVFPKALEQGESFALRIKYRGREVLRDAGDGNYYVRSRTAWYPNLGTFTDMSTYDLTYRLSKVNQIVSVGDVVSDTVTGDQRVAVFKVSQPVRAAGFNVGKFRKISRTDKDTGLAVDVYTNPGTPNVIREINAALASYREESTVTTSYGTSVDLMGGPSQIFLDTNGLAESAMADAINTSRVATTYFGAAPLKHVAITQQTQWDFGQSWPGLIYMPYLAAISGTVRASLGGARDNDFLEQVGPHEMAHQWWGHTVGAATYHDAWLNEGFAEFTTALVLQHANPKRLNAFWENARKYATGRTVGAFIDNADAGPITQGWRLSTWRNRSAYAAMVYEKGAYVLHMLRMMMQDRANKQNPDAPFIAMMTDFVKTYSGRNATTEDFKAIVQKHMTPSLNATGDGKIDWFFNQWVYGTAIPRYTSKFDVKPGADGKFRITGSITQADVPQDFRVLVPVYVEFDKGQVFKVAAIPMIGSGSRDLDFEVKLPKKPNKISLNALHDVLAR